VSSSISAANLRANLKGAVKASYHVTLADYGENFYCAETIAELNDRFVEFESTLEKAYELASCWDTVDNEQRTLRNISVASDAVWDAIQAVKTCGASTPALTIQDGTIQPQARVEDLDSSGPSLASNALSDTADATLHSTGLFEVLLCCCAPCASRVLLAFLRLAFLTILKLFVSCSRRT
jgi:hypothetical protein